MSVEDLRRQTQAFLHDPEAGVRGDCYRTAIACLLGVDRDDVPHVPENDEKAIRARTKDFLGKRGLAISEMPITSESARDVVVFMARVTPPGVRFLLSGLSPRDRNHTTVVHEDGGEPWDPHPSRDGLVGLCDDGYWWVGMLVGA